MHTYRDTHLSACEETIRSCPRQSDTQAYVLESPFVEDTSISAPADAEDVEGISEERTGTGPRVEQDVSEVERRDEEPIEEVTNRQIDVPRGTGALTKVVSSRTMDCLVEMMDDIGCVFGSKIQSMYMFWKIVTHPTARLESYCEKMALNVRSFCESNSDCLLNGKPGDRLPLVEPVLLSATRPDLFYLNFTDIDNHEDADRSTRRGLHMHLVKLLAVSTTDVSTRKRAKQFITSHAVSDAEEVRHPSKLDSVLSAISRKLESANISKSSSMEESVENILKSGVVSDVMALLKSEDGSLDMASMQALLQQCSPMMSGMMS